MSAHGMTAPVMTAAAKFWYVLQCIFFGAGYFTKVPQKKAFSEVGLCELTSWESFWYVLQCIFFGAGYFAKIITKKALSELPQFQHEATGQLTRMDRPAVEQ
jgi:hypothetical protein